ncbi:acyl-CoA thioesterase [Actinophytocola oryzae]|uniref:Acyl-CoA thioester hydrolase n=1 Tax=Actinophytocola oryzae TaxID=502181 RepID=A0A4V3FV30_9PSEU|nr:thioesterase family protein [Actinophytocola oryzae]TDV57581.1 acyl-CoA thioester hydrolase [Actinophytocola oryzae]
MNALPEHGLVETMFVHFDDLDSMGMVHNTRYAVLVERALSVFWDRQGYGYHDGKLGHPDASVGVAEFSITYRTPVRGTGDIVIHIVVERVGESSVVYGFRVLDTSGATVHAEGRRVHIHLDPKTFRPAPWAEETRAIYKTLQAPE